MENKTRQQLAEEQFAKLQSGQTFMTEVAMPGCRQDQVSATELHKPQ